MFDIFFSVIVSFQNFTFICAKKYPDLPRLLLLLIHSLFASNYGLDDFLDFRTYANQQGNNLGNGFLIHVAAGVQSALCSVMFSFYDFSTYQVFEKKRSTPLCARLIACSSCKCNIYTDYSVKPKQAPAKFHGLTFVKRTVITI